MCDHGKQCDQSSGGVQAECGFSVVWPLRGLREISVLGGGDGTAAAMAILLHDRTWPEFDECLFMLMARLC